MSLVPKPNRVSYRDLSSHPCLHKATSQRRVEGVQGTAKQPTERHQRWLTKLRLEGWSPIAIVRELNRRVFPGRKASLRGAASRRVEGSPTAGRAHRRSEDLGVGARTHRPKSDQGNGDSAGAKGRKATADTDPNRAPQRKAGEFTTACGCHAVSYELTAWSGAFPRTAMAGPCQTFRQHAVP